MIGKEVNVFPYLKRCTLDIICEAAMGIQLNAQQMILTTCTLCKDKFSTIMFEYFASIWSLLPNWMYFMTKRGKEYQKYLKVIHDFTMKVIRDRKIELEQKEAMTQIEDQEEDTETQFKPKKRRAFLHLPLTAAKEGGDLTDMNIRNEVDTFMFEGHDTTACAAVWFLYSMGTHPEHQELIRKELDDVFGNSNRPCPAEDTAKLKYLEWCIKEALRLYPSVLNIKRYNSEDFVLSNGYEIPAVASYSIHIYTLHRNQKEFENPLTFNPERFQIDQNTGRHPFAFVPFSAGPRNCIGQKFAMNEENVIFSTLLRRFRFAYDTEKHGPALPCVDMLLKPHHDTRLTITPLVRE